MAMILDSLDLAADPAWAGEQLEWVDEFDWSPVAQQHDRALSGGLIIQQGSLLYGRPITLKSNGGCWFPLHVVRALEVLRDLPGRVMPLTLPDGRQFSVVFDHSTGKPLQARPVWRQVNPGDDHDYEIELYLLTVAPPGA